MMSYRTIAVLVLPGALLLAGGARAETRILFISDRETANSTYELYTMRPDGSDLTRITNNGASEWAPALAPDNHRIAYVDPNVAGDNLFITDLDGAAPLAVGGDSGKALSVQWGDDDTLYFLRETGSSGNRSDFQLWRINTDGSQAQQVYDTTYRVFKTGNDSFSIDRQNERVWFTAKESFASRPVLIQSGPLAARSPDSIFDAAPSFVDHYDVVPSPDGTRIAYTADFGEGSHALYVRDSTGEASTQTLLSDVYVGDPDWDPTGEWLAFTRTGSSTFGARPYIGDIWRVDADGLNITNLTAGTVVSGGAAHANIFDSTPLLIGDLTGDGFVAFEDLTVLLAAWNTMVSAAEGNLVDPEGTVVNFEDLTVLLSEWTGPAPGAAPAAAEGAANAVPEPSTLLLALMSLCALAWRPRRLIRHNHQPRGASPRLSSRSELTEG